MMRFRRQSVALYNELGVFNAVGSVRIALGRDSRKDLQRAVSRAAAVRLSAELIGPMRCCVCSLTARRAREWADALWARAVREFESPELQELLTLASQADVERA